MSKPSTVTDENPAIPAKTFCAGRELQRDYRQLLDQAHDSPVAILDTDGTRLVVTQWERFAFQDAVLRIMDALAQFNAVYARHINESPEEWAAMTPFPFLAAFDDEDVAEFAKEQIPTLEECLRRRDLTAYFGNLRAWESSAEGYGNKELLRQMHDDAQSLIPLHPPL